jgi:hypothetical protein
MLLHVVSYLIADVSEELTASILRALPDCTAQYPTSRKRKINIREKISKNV